VLIGPPGSGKTMLAVERARRLAQRGQKVLFVCFNRALRDHLRGRERGAGVEFHTFHGLCTAMASRAPGVELPKHADAPPPAYWSDELPDALVDAMAELGGQFDALIIDEAQDLQTHWLTAAMACLRDDERDPVWLFMDVNQHVYETSLDVPEDWPRHDLTVNCRNTQEIHREVVKKYRGVVKPTALRGPSGRPVALHRAEDPVAAVAGVIEDLCGPGDVAPQDVVVLSSHALERSDFAAGMPGSYRLTKEHQKPGNWIQFSSIRAFKGLEAPAVVMCELEDLDEMSYDQQLYVGLSRARNHCVIVVPEPVSERTDTSRPS